MIHSPIHLHGVIAYGIFAAVCLGFFVVRLRAKNAERRVSGWMLLSVGVGMAVLTVDEWRLATHWPPVGVGTQTALHNIGMLCNLATVVWMLIWTWKRHMREHQEKKQ